MRRMTIGQILAYVDRIKTNSFAEVDKVQWINEIEYRIQYEIMLLAAENMRDYVYEDIVNCRAKYSNNKIELSTSINARAGGKLSISSAVNKGTYSVTAVSDDGKTIITAETLREGQDTSDAQFAFDGSDCELLIPAAWGEIYYDYLLMKMSEHLEESSEQNNRAATFSAAYDRLAVWYASTYSPANGKAEFKGYYIKGDAGPQGDPGPRGEAGPVGPQGVLRINLIHNENETYTADKTWDEIESAIEQNLLPYVVDEYGYVYNLDEYKEILEIKFASFVRIIPGEDRKAHKFGVTIMSNGAETSVMKYDELIGPIIPENATEYIYLKNANDEVYELSVSVDGEFIVGQV